jgi:PTS system nitrogen regulatory IIA component
MVISDFLRPENVLTDLRAASKRSLLQELANRAGAVLALPPERVYSELAKREELGSTGTGGGIATPHARMPEIQKPFGMLARLRQPIAFDAIDNQPVRIVFLLLTPTTSAGEQLAALAVVARKLREPSIVRRLDAAEDSAELYRAITMEDGG